MAILNANDIKYMEDIVKEVIDCWQTKITIYSKLDIDQQDNYNELMMEFTGDIYASKTIISAERKDIVNNMTNDFQPDSIPYGKRNEGTILFAILDSVDVYDEDNNVVGTIKYKPTPYDIVKIDDSDEVYYIRSIRDRIGETLLTIRRFVGNAPTIVEKEDKIIINNYKWTGGEQDGY